MSPKASRRAAWLLSACVLFLLALLGVLLYSNMARAERIAWAVQETEGFEGLRREAAEAEPSRAVHLLHYTATMQTHQRAGTGLDRIVEQARKNAVREIIADLRARTGEDFGDDPQRWVEHYGVH